MSPDSTSDLSKNPDKLADHLFRTQYGRMVSILTSLFGFDHFDAVEDMVQETLIQAYKTWGYGKLPENPEAWLMTVAKNKTLNYLKREKVKTRVYGQVEQRSVSESNVDALFLENEIEDSMLRMIFACCTSTLAPKDQIAVILKTLCGFGIQEIARAFLVEEEAMAKRVYRARESLKKSGVVTDIPKGPNLEQHLETTRVGLYLLFNEGYNSSSTETLIRKDLCLEAMRLCRLLTKHFPKSRETQALLALMCFHSARFDSRLDDRGAIVIFEEQDRSLWDKKLIDSGLFYLSEASAGEQMSSFHLEAAIAAQHCFAESFEKTNWRTIKTLYQQLFGFKPSPIIQLNLAIIEEKLSGPQKAIAALEKLSGNKVLKNYHLYHATLGEFYRKSGETKNARSCFDRALAQTHSAREREFLQAKRNTL